MKIDLRRTLAGQPFEQKIRKVAQLIQLAAKVKRSTAVEEPFNGTARSESVLSRDWNSPEEDAASRNL